MQVRFGGGLTGIVRRYLGRFISDDMGTVRV